MKFGSRFFTKVYIVGAVFEVMQNHCKPHLGFSHVKRHQVKQPLSVVHKPVLNPSHRGVLDDAEQASLLVNVRELNLVLVELMEKNKGKWRQREIWRLAHEKNKVYTRYTEECLPNLLAAQEG